MREALLLGHCACAAVWESVLLSGVILVVPFSLTHNLETYSGLSLVVLGRETTNHNWVSKSTGRLHYTAQVGL